MAPPIISRAYTINDNSSRPFGLDRNIGIVDRFADTGGIYSIIIRERNTCKSDIGIVRLYRKRSPVFKNPIDKATTQNRGRHGISSQLDSPLGNHIPFDIMNAIPSQANRGNRIITMVPRSILDMDFKILKAYILIACIISTDDKRFFLSISPVNRITIEIQTAVRKTNRFQLVFPMDRFFVFP